MVTSTANHPLYIDMISDAIETLKNRKGSSKVAIVKYIKEKYPVSENANQIVKMTILRNLNNGKLKQVSGVGANGSFKLGQVSASKPKKKTTAKPSTPKKARAKTSKVKKAKSPAPKPKTATTKKLQQKKKTPQKKKTTPKKKPAKKTSSKGKKK